MHRSIETRIRRIEQARADGDAAPITVAFLAIAPGEDAEPHVAAHLAQTGQRRDRTPVLIYRANWPLARAGRFKTIDP